MAPLAAALRGRSWARCRKLTGSRLWLSLWHNKILHLLSMHMICLIDNTSAFYVALRDSKTEKVVMISMDRWPGQDGNDFYAPRA